MAKILTSTKVDSVEVFDISMPNTHNFIANNIIVHNCDMDVSDQQKVIEYLHKKYGNKVCRLSTDLLLRIKSSIKDAERAMFGKVRPETERMCTKLPSTPQGTEDYEFVFGKTDKDGNRVLGLIDTSHELKEYSLANPEIWNTITEMLGIQRGKSVHSCGFIIADKPITDYMPLIKVNDDWVSAFSPKSAEAIGLVKFDLLGLNTLRDIQLCLKSIRDRLGITLEWNNLPYDENAYNIFNEGYTAGVFQFDTPTIRPFVIKTKPKSLDALAALTALGRPGTLDALDLDGRTLAEVYVARANGEPIKYLHPDLEPIFKETYGIALFQEQTIQVFKDIGGMDDAEADEVRRGIGKKIEKVLIEATSKLKEACLRRGWTDDQVALLVQQILASANYSFNKSHASAYSYVAYACLYLRVNYPLDWWKAILSNSTKDELATKFWRHVQDFVVLPDINISTDNYEIKDNKIIAPFSILTGVGEKAYQDLMKHKPYTSLEHFIRSHFPTKEEELLKKIEKQNIDKQSDRSKKSAVNAGIARKLIAAGVLDSLFEPGLSIQSKEQLFEDIRAQVKGKKKSEEVPQEYKNVSSLGSYLLKKQLIQIHSEDLRPLMLPYRGGVQLPLNIAKGNINGWFTQDGYPVLDGTQLEYFQQKFEEGVSISTLCRQFDMLLPYNSENVILPAITGIEERRFYVLAYVISEKSFPYKNKTKYANRMVLDTNGFFSENMLWPPKDQDVAPMGFKKLPVLASFYLSRRGITLGSILPQLTEADLENFSMQ